jgi:hypothetical protein
VDTDGEGREGGGDQKPLGNLGGAEEHGIEGGSAVKAVHPKPASDKRQE